MENITDIAKSQILEKVKEISKVHPEGEKFFDALDKEIIETATPEILRAIFELVPENHYIVLSGGFGKKIAEGIDNGSLPQISYHLYKGGIRSGGEVKFLRGRAFPGQRYTEAIFLDDSIYGGKTFYILKEQYEKVGKKLDFCGVIYDGCPVKKPYVSSVFRYYDHFQAKPNYEF
jgi:hypothetical protein